MVEENNGGIPLTAEEKDCFRKANLLKAECKGAVCRERGDSYLRAKFDAAGAEGGDKEGLFSRSKEGYSGFIYWRGLKMGDWEVS